MSGDGAAARAARDERSDRLWQVGFTAFFVIALVALIVWTMRHDPVDDLDACGQPPSTPCLTPEGLVLVPDRAGGYETLTPDTWRRERAEALSDEEPPPDYRGP